MVSSTADVFPLARTAAQGTDLPNGAINGTGAGSLVGDEALGSDESLGGALLTPIPWLSNTEQTTGSTEGITLSCTGLTAAADHYQTRVRSWILQRKVIQVSKRELWMPIH